LLFPDHFVHGPPKAKGSGMHIGPLRFPGKTETTSRVPGAPKHVNPLVRDAVYLSCGDTSVLFKCPRANRPALCLLSKYLTREIPFEKRGKGHPVDSIGPNNDQEVRAICLILKTYQHAGISLAVVGLPVHVPAESQDILQLLQNDEAFRSKVIAQLAFFYGMSLTIGGECLTIESLSNGTVFSK
jgi:hypothetical protein